MRRFERPYWYQVRDAVLAVFLVYIIFVVIIWATQRSMMYYPDFLPPVYTDKLDAFTPVTVTTADDIEVTGYFSAPENNQPILILFHGNASNPAYEAFKTSLLREQGYGVLLAGYRGYGGNPGQPTENGFYIDADSYIRWVQKNFPGHPLVYYGASIGSGVAVEMSLRISPAALILETPFSSALSVAQKAYFFIPFLDKIMKDQYRSDLKIGKISAPSLFLLAGKDEVIGLASGQYLYQLANGAKSQEIFPEAGHADIYAHGAEQKVVNFLRKVFP